MLKMTRTLPEGCVYTTLNSPVGMLSLIASDSGLHAVLWEKYRKEPSCKKIFNGLERMERHPVLLKTKRQLKEYFSGKRRSFDIPLVLDGTPFQKRSWKKLQKIPYGRTISYLAQAKSLGDPKKARAVGGANARNPVSIIIPCHRVVAKNGALTGFGGGLKTKDFLIRLERESL